MSPPLILLCYPHEVCTVPKPFWETLGLGENHTKHPKIDRFPPSEESLSPNLHPPLLKVLFLPHQIAILFNHQIHASFVVAVIGIMSFFLPSSLMCTSVILILINIYLLNVVFSMTKTLNGQNPYKKNFHTQTLNAIWKTQFFLILVFLFFSLPFPTKQT